MRPEDKKRVLEEVMQRVFQEKVSEVVKQKTPLETVIGDTIYHERQRLEKERRKKSTIHALQYWKKIQKRLFNASEQEKENILKEIIALFANEIVGNFNPKVYKFSTKILPIALSLLLNATSPKIVFSHFPKVPDLSDRLIIQGEIELLQELHKKGTVILVPTHCSNMDSIIIGFALHKIGLPPFTYGAGINLFTNRIISYFMHNLGAYKVDRKKNADLYKDVLKEYATCTIESGYNNLFFPGGTRSRSGSVETHLKLGLLGTGIKAYINNLKARKESPRLNIFVVPCTITYQLVLEAEHLIEDFLKETGKSRYIIEDDEFSQPTRIMNFLSSILSLDSRIYVTICPGLDLFGNRVDRQGISYDNRGRPIDIVRYVLTDGKIEHDPQRDMEYTKELGDEIQKLFQKNNVVMSTHLMAFVVYRLMVRYNREMDLYRLIQTGGKEDNLPFREVYENMEKLLTRLKKMEDQGKIKIDGKIRNASLDAIIDEALQHFRIYHTKVAIARQGDRIYYNDPGLVFYYHNRLQNYGLEKEMEG